LKADRYAKDIFKTLEDLSNNSSRISISIKNSNVQDEDYGTDEYYIRIGDRPPRFRLYQHARWEKLNECQGVDDFITLDELNFILKQQLAMTPEARYQHRRNKGLWHDCGIESAGVDCNPSCKFYPPVGRIEDQEIIEEHNRDVERMKQEGRIVEPPSEEEMLRISSSEDL
jgi:hypothetical protein